MSILQCANNFELDNDTNFTNAKHLTNIVQKYFEFFIKNMQLKIILHVMRKNLIIIARTRFEKRFFYQAFSFTFDLSKFALIIMLLLILKKNQYQILQKISNCRSIILNQNNNNRSILAIIRTNNYTYNQFVTNE